VIGFTYSFTLLQEFYFGYKSVTRGLVMESGKKQKQKQEK
jgi:hypothetical protein